jgi:hypothetical protein
MDSPSVAWAAGADIRSGRNCEIELQRNDVRNMDEERDVCPRRRPPVCPDCVGVRTIARPLNCPAEAQKQDFRVHGAPLKTDGTRKKPFNSDDQRGCV